MRVSRVEVVQWLVLAGMYIAAVASWSSAPERVPIHWGITGEIDAWGGKREGLLLTPILATLMYLLLLGVDRLAVGIGGAQRTIAVARVGTLLLMAGVYTVTLLTMRGVSIPLVNVVSVLIGGLVAALGMAIMRDPPRTPDAPDPVVAGRLIVIAGILAMASGALAGRWALAGTLVVLVALGIVTIVLSVSATTRRTI